MAQRLTSSKPHRQAPQVETDQRQTARAALTLFAWIVVALLCAGICVANLVERYQLLLHPGADLRAGLASLGVSIQFHAAWNIALQSIVAASYFGMAALIAWRKPRDIAALTIALALVAFGAALPGTIYAVLIGQPIWIQPNGFLQILGWMMLLVFAFIFPNGRFVPHWTLLLMIPWAAWVISFFLFAGRVSQSHPWVIGLTFVIWAVWFAVGAAAQYYRYIWVSNWVQRQQTKWVVFGFLGMQLGIFVTVLVHVASLVGLLAGSTILVLRIASVVVLCVTTLLVPLTVSIALLRYRLFNVDSLINRTLVYGSLTFLLACTYFVTVALLGVLFSAVSHEPTKGSQVAITLSTLFIATLFQPLRGKIQQGINRRFYRSNYNAARTIAAFAAKLPSLVDIEQLTDGVLSAVEETMRPASAALWLFNSPRQPDTAATPDESGRSDSPAAPSDGLATHTKSD